MAFENLACAMSTAWPSCSARTSNTADRADSTLLPQDLTATHSKGSHDHPGHHAPCRPSLEIAHVGDDDQLPSRPRDRHVDEILSRRMGAALAQEHARLHRLGVNGVQNDHVPLLSLEAVY